MSIDTPSEPENLIAAAIDAAEDIRDPLDAIRWTGWSRQPRPIPARLSRLMFSNGSPR
jgi:hypothetical protein